MAQDLRVLTVSHQLRPEGHIRAFSVGSENPEKNVSPKLVLALHYVRSVDSKIAPIVKRDGGCLPNREGVDNRLVVREE
jgi:hypothetical protein